MHQSALHALKCCSCYKWLGQRGALSAKVEKEVEGVSEEQG